MPCRCAARFAVGHEGSACVTSPPILKSDTSAFFWGAKSALLSVFSLVLAGTYVGMGALAQGVGLSPLWLAASTVLVWAAPAQLILITGLGTGSALIELAIAVTLSAMRLFPMVVALLPLIKGGRAKTRDLLLPAALHLDQHVGGIAASVADYRAGTAHRIL